MTLIKPVLIAVILAFLAGCATTGPGKAGCPNVRVKTITIHFKEDSQIRITPPEAIVKEGRALRFKFRGVRGKTVKVRGKGADDVWIMADGIGGDKDDVCVGQGRVEAGKDETTFRYSVEVSGIGMIDPRVKVKR